MKRTSPRFALAILSLLLLVTAAPAHAAWPLRAGGTTNNGADTAYEVITTPTGNVFVVGGFSGLATFGEFPQTLSSNGGSEDIFVMRLDPAGNVSWVRGFGSASTDRALAVVVDGSEDVYVTGSFTGSVTFGPTTLTSNDAYSDIFILKVRGDNGDPVWAKRAGGSWVDEGRAIGFIPAAPSNPGEPPNKASVIVGGRYQGSNAVIGGTAMSGGGTSASGPFGLFVARLDTDGNFVWVIDQPGVASGGWVDSIETRPSGELYVMGQKYVNTEIVRYNFETAKSSDGTQQVVGDEKVFPSGWSASGLWRAATDCDAAVGGAGHSTPNAAHYGRGAPNCDFDGGLTSGSLQSGAISLAGAIGATTLNFKYLLGTENNSSFDHATFQVWHSSTGWQTFDKDSNRGGNLLDNATWRTSNTYDLSSFNGSTIYVRFLFSTNDGILNDFKGFYVDDVVITGSEPQGFVAKIQDSLQPTAAWQTTGGWPLVSAPSGLKFNDMTVLDNQANLIYLAATASGAVNFGTCTSAGTCSVTQAGAVAVVLDDRGPSWTWASGAAGGKGSAITTAWVDDGSGPEPRVFLAGSFTGSIDLGSLHLNANNGSEDVLVAALDGGGDWLWATGGNAHDPDGDGDGVPGIGGGDGTDKILAISSDGVASLHVVGSFEDVAIFGDDETVESAGGPDALAANLDFSGRWFNIETWIVGQEIPRPPGTENAVGVTDAPKFLVSGEEVSVLDSIFKYNYDGTVGRLYGLQPSGQIEIHWRVFPAGQVEDQRIVRIGRMAWPTEICEGPVSEECYQVHVLGASAEAEPADESWTAETVHTPFVQNSGGAISGSVFEAVAPGYAVIQYRDGAIPPGQFATIDIEVVRSFARENSPDWISGIRWDIGMAITDPDHQEVGRSGYVLNYTAFYDPVAYDRTARTGPVLPVNRVNAQRSQDVGKDMDIAWYTANIKGVFWPTKAVRYDCQWPLDPDRIIIASQEGTEVLGQPFLDPLVFPSMEMYVPPVDENGVPDVTQPGYNPNDEHAVWAPSSTGSGFQALFALRSDFGSGIASDPGTASDPYVLMRYWNPVQADWAMKVYHVRATGAGFDSFWFDGVAGTTVSPPYPLRLLASCAETFVQGQQAGQEPPPPFYKDHKQQLWAMSGGPCTNGTCAGSAGVVLYHYPLQPGFLYDLVTPASGCIPWLGRLPVDQGGTDGDTDPIEVGYTITWPPDPPLLLVGETLLEPKRGLPDIFNQAAVRVVFDELVARNNDEEIYDPLNTLVRVVEPLVGRSLTFDPDEQPATIADGDPSPDTVCYEMSGLPADLATSIDIDGTTIITGSADGTVRLPFVLRSRLRYNPLAKKLTFKGTFDDSQAGEPLLLLNTMTGLERNLLRNLSSTNVPSGTSAAWNTCITKMYKLSRNPNLLSLTPKGQCSVECTTFDLPSGGSYNVCTPSCPEPDVTVDSDLLIGLQDNNPSGGDGIPESLGGVGSGKALTAGFAKDVGYITVAFNDHASLGALPVSLNVIKVDCLRSPEPPATAEILSSYQGEIKIIESDNIFDEQLTLRHSGDFAGASDSIEFEWYFHPDIDGTPPTPLPEPDIGQLNGWQLFPVADSNGAVEVTFGGANIQTLSDNWFVVRYRGLCEECDTQTNWGLWAGQPGSTPREPRAMLAEGWVKRVVRRLNPFEARVQAFHSSSTNNFASMLVQLGERYEGDIALNNDPDNLNNIGLIEAYETVLRRAMMLSIDSTPPVNYEPANAAILLVASRLVDFYLLLGNEAYADAQDPTIGISTDSVQFGFGSLAPTIFNFQNQVASLLEEELLLLRGRDDSQGPVAARPVYNRAFWNFTSGEGEVAYALSYNISDQNVSGVIDEIDARILYPQGHGDAWGHYTTAIKKYYMLLQHPFYSWNPRPEAVLVAGVPIQVDFFDERKFANVAAAKARAGAEIVDLTYRQNYVEDPAGQWQGYKDTDSERAWGLAEWGNRAGTGAYIDWVVGNAILPEEDPDTSHVGIQKIQRSTVNELDEIAGHYRDIQAQVDEADRGLNPLGVAKGSVPFDIDPSLVDQGQTHFEQIFDRAMTTLDNAVDVWDFANQLNRMLRFNQDTIDDLTINALDTEISFNGQLISIFGNPYEADIGPPNGLYPEGYQGPDLYHYMMVDAPAMAGTPFATNCDPSATAVDPGLCYGSHSFTSTYSAAQNGVNFFNICSTTVDVGLDCGTNALGDGCSLGSAPTTATSAGRLNVSYTTVDDPDSGFFFVKDSAWPADTRRRATGKLQDAAAEIVQAQIGLKKAFRQHFNLMKDVNDLVDEMQATFNIRGEQLSIANAERKELNQLTISAEVLKGVATGARRLTELLTSTFKDVSKCVPDNFVAGLAAGGDVFSVAQCSIHAGSSAGKFVGDTIADAIDIAANAIDAAKEDVGLQASIEVQIQDVTLEMFNLKGSLDHLFREEPVYRAEILAKAEAVAQAERKWLSALAEGQRTFSRLIKFRKDGAAAVQEHRYQDMAFRIFRNDALQKYRASFDMAARYTYLAASAYDYETNLLGTDAEAGQNFLTDIVSERSLGQILNGEPVPGSRGLADPLGRMEQNFVVLKGQMGFNNPQTETNRFSVRHELLRIGDGAESDGEWREALDNYRVTDLWQVPEFRRFCRPFAPESDGPQPGLVIPFPTTVTFGLNFFGWPLGPGDSAYDPTHFATRVRGVGLWFEDYASLPLSNTPRAYLIPVGADVLRAPSADDFTTRDWTVVDQVLPVPFPIGAQALSEPMWTPLEDMLSGPFGEIRRFSSFRAFHYSEPFDEGEIISDSRLIGRSVWNTQWMLIIPGGTLLFDSDEGLDTFVDGLEVPGTGDRDGEGVSDIKLFFQTYSYSGNK